jgi:hypothetical protein
MPDIESKPEVMTLTRDQLVQMVNAVGRDVVARGGKDPADQFREEKDKYSSRGGKKYILENAGVTLETGNEYRLLVYRDKGQDVIFRGKSDGDGTLVLTHSASVLGPTEGPFNFIKELPKSDFQPLPRPIEIKSPEETPQDGPGFEFNRLELDDKRGKQLALEVTLLARSDEMKLSKGVAVASLPAGAVDHQFGNPGGPLTLPSGGRSRSS